MSSILSRVFGAVSSFAGKNKASDSGSQDKAGRTEVMAGATGGAVAPVTGKNPRKRLFDDEGDEEEAGDIGTSESLGKTSTFEINEEYARRFEHNKKREEKQKLEEKYGKDAANNMGDEDEESSSEDETEDEDGYLLTEDLDARMTAALQAIKNKDPRIYSTETKFFDPSEIDQAAEDAAKASSSEPKQKPMFLRDYHRERYLRGDIGADEDEDDEKAGKAAPKTYQQEQDEAKQALIDEMNAADEDDGSDGKEAEENDDDIDTFIKPKASSKASKAEAAASGIHPSRAGRVPKITGADIANANKNPELFLSNFLASRAWVPEDKEGGPGWRAFESDDDESENDRAEEFEAAYNLRFEDPDKSNEVLKSYSRSVVAERSVRREDKTGRQRQRDAEKEKQAAEKRERKEERARLRKLRIEEAQEKLAKIKQAAGIRGKEADEDEWAELLDDAWDNEEWEIKMHKHFGDTYYSQADAELGSDNEENEEEKDEGGKSKQKAKKPKWDDDIDINDIIPDFDEANPKITLTDSEGEADEAEEGEEDSEGEDEDGDDAQPAKRRKTTKDRKQERADAKRQARRERARIEALVDRQMELDAPTALAGGSSSKTGSGNSGSSAGFRYRETSPQSFGLTPRDILLAPSDSALNEFAGLKKLATFRDEERKRKDRKKLGKKARLRQWRRDTFGADFEMTGPTYGFERLLGETTAFSSSSSFSAAADHSKHKNKGKGKGNADEEGGEDKSGSKKRKRSGRKGKGGKDKEKDKAAAEQDA